MPAHASSSILLGEREILHIVRAFTYSAAVVRERERKREKEPIMNGITYHERAVAPLKICNLLHFVIIFLTC